jgi:hypothetical protein
LQVLVGHGRSRYPSPRGFRRRAADFRAAIDRGGFRLDDPELADIGPEVIEQRGAPDAAGGRDVLFDEAAQMLHVVPMPSGDTRWMSMSSWL